MPVTIPAVARAWPTTVDDRLDHREKAAVLEVLLVPLLDRSVFGDDPCRDVGSAEIDADCSPHSPKCCSHFGDPSSYAAKNVAWKPLTSPPCAAIAAAAANRPIPSCSTRVRWSTSARSRSTKSTSRSNTTRKRPATTTSTRSRRASGSTSITTIPSSSWRSRRSSISRASTSKICRTTSRARRVAPSAAAATSRSCSESDVARIAEHLGMSYDAVMREYVVPRRSADGHYVGWLRKVSDDLADQCVFLMGDRSGRYYCGIYRGTPGRLPRVHADRLPRRRRIPLAQSQVQNRTGLPAEASAQGKRPPPVNPA